MAAYLSPIGNEQEPDSTGAPVSGALIYTYLAGTTTAVTTYTDAAGLVQQANPIVCNSSGYPASPIYIPAGVAVKMVFTTSVATGSLAYRPPIDNITGVNDPSFATTVSEWTAFSGTPSYISATSFSVTGDQTGTFQMGRRLKSTNTGGTIYSTVRSSVFGSVTTVTVVNDSGALDAGLLAVSYGLQSTLNTSLPQVGRPEVQDFRLTLTTLVPVTTADVTGGSTLFACPYKGNQIALYVSSTWLVFSTAQFSLALSGLTSGKPYDVFAYASSGVPTLEFLVWTNDTTRATALVYQDGVPVKSGDATRRYMGTFYTTAATTTEDSMAKRFLWNYYHRVVRPMRVLEATDTWNYSTAAWRQMNNSTANQLDMVRGLDEDAVTAATSASAFNSTATRRAVRNGVGLDVVNAFAPGCMPGRMLVDTGTYNLASTYQGLPGVGRHFLAALEYGDGTDTQTWAGDAGTPLTVQNGITGVVMA